MAAKASSIPGIHSMSGQVPTHSWIAASSSAPITVRAIVAAGRNRSASSRMYTAHAPASASAVCRRGISATSSFTCAGPGCRSIRRGRRGSPVSGPG